MPHIAEGLLHAHLDGALGPDEQLQWTAAERHLEVCPDCRERLEEARDLRARARDLLAGTEASVPPGPGFEALAAEADARRAGGDEGMAGARSGDWSGRSAVRDGGRAPWWRSAVRLAWAASLVMAAGAGWIGHELLVEQDGEVSRRVAESPTTEREQVQQLADEVRQDERAAAPSDMEAADETGIPESAAARPRAAEPDGAAKAQALPTDRQLEDRVGERAVAGSCFEPVSAMREPGMPGPLGMLVLASDRTIRSEAGGRPLVGFWDALPPDSLEVRLTDGSRWFELLLRRDEDRLTGTTADGEAIGFRLAECPSR